MLRKNKLYAFSIIGMILILSLAIPLIINHSSLPSNNDKFEDNPYFALSRCAFNSNPNTLPQSSLSLDGINKIKISKLARTMEMKGTGLLSITDSLTIQNQNNFSISSILIGIPLNNSDNLIYLRAQSGLLPLSSKKTDFILQEGIQAIVISLATPLQENQTITLNFYQVYKDTINFESVGTINNPDERLSFSGYIFPLLPYDVDGTIYTKFILPEGQSLILDKAWGQEVAGENALRFEWTPGSLEPFLDNMGGDEIISIVVKDITTSKLEINQLIRTITISPWGIMKVKEKYVIRNNGTIAVEEFEISIPEIATNLEVYDFLGEFDVGEIDIDQQQQQIKGIQFLPNPFLPGFQTGTFQIAPFRGNIQPGAAYQFSLEYQVNLNEYLSKNLLQQSVQMFIYPSYFEYLAKNQLTQITIDGASNIDSISPLPYGITNSRGEITLTYYENDIVPAEIPLLILSFSYTIDIFRILSWPILYIIVILSICSILVLLIKKQKEPEIVSEPQKEELPVSEIKEFCSLYAEKHALLLEVAKAEEELKNKKLPKKKYRTITKRNEAKIKEIDEEIKPFKETLRETNATFENIINNLELLEAERMSAQDGLKLLEARYKRGKMSRSAYASLSNDFIKRLNKVDRSIDKSIQQLRSYVI
ncbi:MAG: putative Ribophorin 1 superfamily protein [Promethearchaeota archaeon]|nr:MAG: putative Ribophorin 1 superfamily protein [Candidatus Lokiarchaeota archaeon]